MSTYNAFYVRKQATDEATLAAILSLYPKAETGILPNYIGAVLSADDVRPPEQKLAGLSAELATDIIWVTYQTTAESFIFHHWQTGSLLRALEYGCAHEGTWDRVEGQTEPWERDYFWNEESLEGHLECAETQGERQKLQKLWKDGLLIQGKTAPSAGSDAAAEAVMEHYGLFYPSKPTTAATSPASPPKQQGLFSAIWFYLPFVKALWRLRRRR